MKNIKFLSLFLSKWCEYNTMPDFKGYTFMNLGGKMLHYHYNSYSHDAEISDSEGNLLATYKVHLGVPGYKYVLREVLDKEWAEREVS